MALSPYIDEQTLTTAIKNNVPLNKQGTLTQIITTNTYSVEDGLYHYEIIATGGTNNYPVASATAASATTVAGIRFSGTEGTATFDITPTGEGFSYIARPISEFYGPVETAVVTGVTGAVRAGSPGIGAGIQFDGAVFWNKVENVVDANKTMDYLQQRVGHGGDSHYLTLFYTDGTSYAFENGGDVYEALYGITYTGTPDYSGFDYIDLTATTALMSLSKRIKKLYGSVNGQTKLIYQETA